MKQRMLRAAIAVALATVVGAFRFLSIAGFSNDHYMHVAAGQQISMGEWPSRDYVELGTAADGAAVGDSVLARFPMRRSSAKPCSSALMFASGRRAHALRRAAADRLRGGSRCSSVALEVVIFPRTYSYPKILAYAAGFLAMWRYVDRPSLTRVVAAGRRRRRGVWPALRPRHLRRLRRSAHRRPGGRCRVGSRQDGLRTVTAFIGAVLLLLAPYIMYVDDHDGLWRHLLRGSRAAGASRAREAARYRSSRSTAVCWSRTRCRGCSSCFIWLPLVARRRRVATVATSVRMARELAMVVPLDRGGGAGESRVDSRTRISARLPDADRVRRRCCSDGCWHAPRELPASPRSRGLIMGRPPRSLVTLTRGERRPSSAPRRSNSTRPRCSAARSDCGVTFDSRIAQLARALSAGADAVSRGGSRWCRFSRTWIVVSTRRDHILIPAIRTRGVGVGAASVRRRAGRGFSRELLTGDEDHRVVMSRLARDSAFRVAVLLLAVGARAIAARFPELGALSRRITFPRRIALEGGGWPRGSRSRSTRRLAVGRDRETGWLCYR